MVIVVKLLHLKTFGHEHIQFLVSPLLRRQVLQEGQRVLVVHGLELGGELEEKRWADVGVELGETFFFREVSVPKSYYLVDVELSHQVAVGPSVSKVHEFDVHVIQVFQKFRFLLLDKFLHFADSFVNSRLAFNKIISDILEHSSETPVDISLRIFDFLQLASL